MLLRLIAIVGTMLNPLRKMRFCGASLFFGAEKRPSQRFGAADLIK